MKDEAKAREQILKAVIDLVLDGQDDARAKNSLTFRDIARKAGVSLGLINYHFENRQKLIREAVRWYIDSEVIARYKPEMGAGKNIPKKKTLAGIIQGSIDYIIQAPGLARISILNDMEYPADNDNAAATWNGLYQSLSRLLESSPGRNHKLAVWAAVGSIHEAFLRPDQFKQISGFDLNSEADRKAYASELAGMLLGSPAGKT